MKPIIEWTDTTPEWRRGCGEQQVEGLSFEGAHSKCRIVLLLSRHGVVSVDRLDDASALLNDDVVRALREKVVEMMGLKAVTP